MLVSLKSKSCLESCLQPTRRYTTFPPVLFPDLIEDKSLKTVFGSWKLLAQILKAALCGVTSLHQGSSHSIGAHTNLQKWDICQVMPGSIAWAAVITIFFLSPDTEFSGSGVGKKSNISYKELFYNYKRVLVTKWKSKCIEEIVTKINNYVFSAAARTSTIDADHEDHTNAINRAMVALDVNSDDRSVDAPTHGTPNTVAAAEPASILQLIESISGMSALSNIDESGPDIGPDTETDPVIQELQAAGGGEGRGRGRGRKKKAAAASSGITVTRATHSHK
ncbi:uncharacterized protein EDB91DRAFT_1049942 [Suillus paluster]|uniref:uncharacterized protein n=1 Tax=Suillus paluster TaxID=48578 RepID=UPI001B863902|nr:uncharacterized protein EDB91DRAFT_1049942 [Suillus paluster]KAG1745378.1 hypothetical protein EDB91DRAFT_1049942 [Suillus paluster]